MRLVREKSLLLIVDLQAGLLPVLDGGEQAVGEASWLGGVASALEVPVWLTEQYPAGLGGSEPRLREALEGALYWEKSRFDAHAEPDFAKALAQSGRHQVVLCGAEAHVCVLQTGLGLREAGYEVFWLAEATVSRRREEASLARRRIERAGAWAVSADMAAYEWLERCDDARFGDVHRRFLKPRSPRPLRFFD
ncbi:MULTISPECIES: isochorismatase family protein [Halomonas]|uniref:Hydrolase n=1 Tax=Halomonas halophila TaxID=29573 RepID=A0ABQ0U5E7_9GAMM|nr:MULTISPECIES: isochorismatase family protein [Halomonas]MDR5889928.1 isochorismatase family protein [Halomonas salina]WJY06964.1 isochorismatase family protein [Halomonas halophila]GEK73600.1 hydrolase [Halomonas halophila]